MEYCEYGDLARYLKSHGRLAEDEVRIITTQLLAGLGFIHDEGWAHGDLGLSVSEHL
jgi:serine/threonine protein kinase